jgi:hypothetical protein
MPPSVFERVESLLHEHGIAFHLLRTGHALVENPELGKFAE